MLFSQILFVNLHLIYILQFTLIEVMVFISNLIYSLLFFLSFSLFSTLPIIINVQNLVQLIDLFFFVNIHILLFWVCNLVGKCIDLFNYYISVIYDLYDLMQKHLFASSCHFPCVLVKYYSSILTTKNFL